MRLIARLATGTTKTSSGEIVSIDRSDTLGRAIRSKFAPIPAVVSDFSQGVNFVGDRRDLANPSHLLKGLQDLLAPLSLADIAEGFYEDKLRGGLMSALQLVGLGAQTYRTLTDVQEQASQSMFNKSYNSLNDNQRFQVSQSKEVQAELDRIETNRMPPGAREQLGVLMPNYERRKTELETSFKTDFLDAGVKGEALRDGIQDMKGARYEASQALLGDPQIQAYLDRNADKKPLEDQLHAAYWSADAPMVNGKPDFAGRDAKRAAILQKAQAAGVNPSYITTRNYEKLYADPVVRAAIKEYDADQEKIRDSGYWQIDDQMFQAWLQGKGITSVTMGPDQFFAALEQDIRNAGTPPLVAQAQANKLQAEFSQLAGKAKQYFRLSKRPDIGEMLRKWGYQEPGMKEARALSGLPPEDEDSGFGGVEFRPMQFNPVGAR